VADLSRSARSPLADSSPGAARRVPGHGAHCARRHGRGPPRSWHQRSDVAIKVLPAFTRESVQRNLYRIPLR